MPDPIKLIGLVEKAVNRKRKLILDMYYSHLLIRSFCLSFLATSLYFVFCILTQHVNMNSSYMKT